MRNVLEEFESEKYGHSKPTILSMREHIFTGRCVHSLEVLPNNILSISCFCIILFIMSLIFSILAFHLLLGLCSTKRAFLSPSDNEPWLIT